MLILSAKGPELRKAFERGHDRPSTWGCCCALRRFWKRPLYLDTWCGASSHRSGEVVCKTLKWEWITLKWECMVLLKWELAP